MCRRTSRQPAASRTVTSSLASLSSVQQHASYDKTDQNPIFTPYIHVSLRHKHCLRIITRQSERRGICFTVCFFVFVFVFFVRSTISRQLAGRFAPNVACGHTLVPFRFFSAIQNVVQYLIQLVSAECLTSVSNQEWN